MGRSERYIVGLDIGTSKVCTVVGEVADDGSLDVIGIGVSESKGLKRGRRFLTQSRKVRKETQNEAVIL